MAGLSAPAPPSDSSDDEEGADTHVRPGVSLYHFSVLHASRLSLTSLSLSCLSGFSLFRLCPLFLRSYLGALSVCRSLFCLQVFRLLVSHVCLFLVALSCSVFFFILHCPPLSCALFPVPSALFSLAPRLCFRARARALSLCGAVALSPTAVSNRSLMA